MGATHLDDIANQLMDAGRTGDEPVAIISRGTLADQQVVVSTLADCATALREADLPAPILIVVGPIVALRDRLDWFST